MKKHSILPVLLVLLIAALFLGAVMYIIHFFSGSSSGLTFSNKIGVVPIEGTITDSTQAVNQIVEFRKDKRIKAIILRIDSPGGSVGASQEIYREVMRTTPEKRVVASLGNVAASGGYYVAVAGDRIVANPGTLTGSIGVIMEFVQVKELLKKIGVGLEVMKVGEYKDIGSPHRELTEQDKELIKGLITDIQEQFIKAVAEGRKLPVEKVREVADGRVLTGLQAKESGLVDSLGNFQDAVDIAKEISGIEGDVSLVYPKRTGINLWDLLFQNLSKALFKTLSDHLRTTMEYRWDGFYPSMG